jgi:hypothetical protein
MLDCVADYRVFVRVFASGAVRRRIENVEEREERERKKKEGISQRKEREL